MANVTPTPKSKSKLPPLWLLPLLLIALVLGAALAQWSRSRGPDLKDGPAPRPAPPGMVWIPGGTFKMGSVDTSRSTSGGPLFADTVPVHEVSVTGFYMDIHEVTNDEFAKFVAATGYITLAEKPVDKAELMKTLPPGAEPPPEMLAPGSLVFTPPPGPVSLNDPSAWWRIVPGANWRHPEGPASDISKRGNHPVVHIAWPDAVAYCEWAGKRLPTEAEWERAARGGQDYSPETNNNGLPIQNGRWQANIWQGEFPWQNTAEDGYAGTAPVGSYPVNPYGLHDMAGNVWEWCSDWYTPDVYRTELRVNPPGPAAGFDPDDGNAKRVQRSGSYLCNPGFCSRYKPYGRGKGTPLEATNHVGFRCVMDAK